MNESLISLWSVVFATVLILAGVVYSFLRVNSLKKRINYLEQQLKLLGYTDKPQVLNQEGIQEELQEEFQ